MFEKYFKGYLKDFIQTNRPIWNYETGILLLGAKEMYVATGEVEYCNQIEAYMNHYILEDGSFKEEIKADQYKMGFGQILCFLYEQTKNEKYKIAMETLVNDIKNMKENYVGLPTYLEYETKFNEKENYNDVYKSMKNARKLFEDEALALKCSVYDLMVLIDMHENSSEEVYEQHKQYAIWFKEALKKVMKCDYKGSDEAVIIAYCMLRGCRLGILLQEKYQYIAEAIVENVVSNEFADNAALETVGTAAMAYAEFLRRSEVL